MLVELIHHPNPKNLSEKHSIGFIQPEGPDAGEFVTVQDGYETAVKHYTELFNQGRGSDVHHDWNYAMAIHYDEGAPVGKRWIWRHELGRLLFGQCYRHYDQVKDMVPDCGCPSQVKSSQNAFRQYYQSETRKIDEFIYGLNDFPSCSCTEFVHRITVETLPLFAEVNREMDKEFGIGISLVVDDDNRNAKELHCERLRALKPGDQVYWNDPDDGLCSRLITIKEVKFITSDTDPFMGLMTTEDDGGSLLLECYGRELVVQQSNPSNPVN